MPRWSLGLVIVVLACGGIEGSPIGTVGQATDGGQDNETTPVTSSTASGTSPLTTADPTDDPTNATKGPDPSDTTLSIADDDTADDEIGTTSNGMPPPDDSSTSADPSVATTGFDTDGNNLVEDAGSSDSSSGSDSGTSSGD